MIDLKAYLPLNPFSSASIGDREIWGEHSIQGIDAPEVHKVVSDWLAARYDETFARPEKQASAVHLLGTSGAGKSHLLARLKLHSQESAAFCFVANPPSEPSLLLRDVLSKMIRDIWRREPDPVTGLGFIPDLVLRRFAKRKSIKDIKNLADRIACAELEERANACSNIEKILIRNESVVPILARVLARAVDPRLELVALKWLGGTGDVREEELENLGVCEPLGEENYLEIFRTLGILAAAEGRIIILALDQLDQALGDPDTCKGIGAVFSSLLIDLFDNSRGWFVVVSLLRGVYDDVWSRCLTTPAQNRLNIHDPGFEGQIKREIGPIQSPESRREILRARLNSPSLCTQRAQDAEDDPFFPLTQTTIAEIVDEPGIDTPRRLLARANLEFQQACAGALEVEVPSLNAFLQEKFDEACKRLKVNALPEPNAGIIAERIIPLIRGSLLLRGISDFSAELGDLETLGENASDRVLSTGGRSIRLMGHDAIARPPFPAFMEHVNHVDGEIVLLRDGRVDHGIGRVAKERLQLFERRGGIFIHQRFSREQVMNLYASARVLAAYRAGDYEGAFAEPGPVEEELVPRLSQIVENTGHVVIATILRRLGVHDEPVLERFE